MMDQTGPSVRTIRIADLIGSKVVRADGKRLGHVVDIEVTPGPAYRVTRLVCGRWGWLQRLHVPRVLDHHFDTGYDPSFIPWETVAGFEPYTVRLKPEPDGVGDG